MTRAALRSTDPEERRLAAQALAEDDTEDAPTMIALALGDADWRVRKEAALSAASAPRREKLLALLLEALGDRDNIGFRNSAVEALVAIGPDAVPTAIAALSLDADGRKLAVEVLGGVPDLRGAEALSTMLDDEDANVRQAAAEALGASANAGDEARKTAVRALRGVLPRAEPMLKLAALSALAKLEVALEWSLLEPLVADPLLRGAVIAACARCSDPTCGEALVAALFDPNIAFARAALIALSDWLHSAIRQGLPFDSVAARLQALDASVRVRSLGEIDVVAGGASLTLLALLGDAEAAPGIVRALLDPMLARSAEMAVALLGVAALPALLAVGEREPPSRHAALLLVVPTLTSRVDDRTLAVVRATLAHESDDVAAAAAQVLGALGEPADIERLAVLATEVRGRATSSAAFAIEALAERYAEEARAAFERLSGDPQKTIAGCTLLASLRGSPAGSIDYLRRAMGNGDARARRAAIEAFAAIGGDDARTTVATALTDEDRDVQLAAIRALGHLQHGEALSTLIASVTDGELIAAAASALSEADAERALEVCTRLVTEPDPAVACAAVAALGKLADRALAEEGLVRALDHPNDEVVKLALSELGRAPSERALDRVGKSLEHASWEVRRLAAEVLGAEGSEEASSLLRSRMERETDAGVREAIMIALAARAGFGFGGSDA